jgi:hypothetical protein
MKERFVIQHEENLRYWNEFHKKWIRNPAEATTCEDKNEFSPTIVDLNEMNEPGLMTRIRDDDGELTDVYRNDVHKHAAVIKPFPSSEKIFDSNGNYTDVDLEFDPYQNEYQFELTAYNTDQQPGRVVIHQMMRKETFKLACSILTALGYEPPDWEG